MVNPLFGTRTPLDPRSQAFSPRVRNREEGTLSQERPGRRVVGWRQLSATVVERDGSCRDCGSTHFLAAHHVIPRAEGGADHPANLVTLCARCHAQVERAA